MMQLKKKEWLRKLYDFTLKLSRQFILLINVKVTTFMPSRVEHEPFFYYGLKVHAQLSWKVL